mgnify:CR=1 FL=1
MADSAPATADKLPKDLASGKGMVNVQIDDTWIQVPVGTRMIEACKMAGKEVPHYCYHPKLSSPGNCRMCLVQMGMPPRPAPGQSPTYEDNGYQDIAWMPRPVIACANTVAENMGIRTSGELVEECRNGVMEFLLINHPLDCPICDQAGECSLQEFSVEHGRGFSRFEEMKVKKPKNVEIGPRIRLDDERCIMCSRCIRFMDEVADDPVLGFIDRGTHTTLTVHPGRRLDNNYSLNTADICPVGALTSNDFRFQMRVWFLKETKSLCTGCGTGCNTIIGSRENRMYRYEPRRNDAVNSDWMCDAGRLDYKWIGRDDRLAKVRGPKGDTTWPSALREITDRLAKAEEDSVAVVASARQSNEELFLLYKLAKRFKALTDSVPRKGEPDHLLVAGDRNPNTTGAQLTGITTKRVGSKLGTIAKGIASGKIKTLIVYGEDVTQHGIDAKLLGKLNTLIVSDILPSATTKKADFLLPGCAHAEKRGTFTNVKGRVQRFNKALEPPGDAIPEWEVLHELVHNLTGLDGFNSIEGLFNQMAGEVKAFKAAGLTWGGLGDDGADVKL